MNKFDVIVIGGGILGIAHAYHCLKAGLSVALIEKNDFPNDATVRNFGQIVPSGFGAKWHELGRISLDIFNEIQSKTDISVKTEGSVYLANDEQELALLEELAAINRFQDYESHLLTKAECLAKYDGLKSSYVKGGLFFPQEMCLDPRIAAKRIILYCMEVYGLKYIPHTAIKNMVNANGEVLMTTTDQDCYKAEKVFLCSGCEFQLLYPKLFSNSDLKLVKLQMMDTMPLKRQRIPGSVLTGWTIRRYESFQECPSFADIKSKEDQGSFQNRNGIHILFKQSADGSVIIGDSHQYTSAGGSTDFAFDMDNEINCFMLKQAERIFDFEDLSIRRTWLGFYCQCEKEDIFTLTIDEDIHIVTGIGGKGMTGALGYAQKNINQHLSLNDSGLLTG